MLYEMGIIIKKVKIEKNKIDSHLPIAIHLYGMNNLR